MDGNILGNLMITEKEKEEEADDKNINIVKSPVEEGRSGRTDDDDDGDGANWTITLSLGVQNILSQVVFLFWASLLPISCLLPCPVFFVMQQW